MVYYESTLPPSPPFSPRMPHNPARDIEGSLRTSKRSGGSEGDAAIAQWPNGLDYLSMPAHQQHTASTPIGPYARQRSSLHAVYSGLPTPANEQTAIFDGNGPARQPSNSTQTSSLPNCTEPPTSVPFVGQSEEPVKDEAAALNDDEHIEKDEASMTVAELRAHKLRMKRFRLSHSQTRYLMSEFAKQPHPDGAQRERLSREIPGLSPRQVQVWFQNRRAKLKRLTTDDRERMLKSRALPANFDMTQALHPPNLPRPSLDVTVSPAAHLTPIDSSGKMWPATVNLSQTAPMHGPWFQTHVSASQNTGHNIPGTTQIESKTTTPHIPSFGYYSPHQYSPQQYSREQQRGPASHATPVEQPTSAFHNYEFPSSQWQDYFSRSMADASKPEAPASTPYSVNRPTTQFQQTPPQQTRNEPSAVLPFSQADYSHAPRIDSRPATMAEGLGLLGGQVSPYATESPYQASTAPSRPRVSTDSPQGLRERPAFQSTPAGDYGYLPSCARTNSAQGTSQYGSFFDSPSSEPEGSWRDPKRRRLQ